MTGSEERYNAAALVERHLESNAAKLAYVAADATLTYGDLYRQVCRAGNLLRELGLRREERVLLVLDDTTVFPILFLGAMRIGAVPVSVSALDRADNFVHYVEDSYTRLGRHRRRLPGTAARRARRARSPLPGPRDRRAGRD